MISKKLSLRRYGWSVMFFLGSRRWMFGPCNIRPLAQVIQLDQILYFRLYTGNQYTLHPDRDEESYSNGFKETALFMDQLEKKNNSCFDNIIFHCNYSQV